ncbi:MAG: ribosome maturation factor RimP [Thermoanaerobaculia bacterium]
MAKNAIDPELTRELAEIAAAQGCELLRAEFQGGTLRLILDRVEGVRLEDCEAVSKQASALLDVSDFGRGRYTLEVSSPGLDRELYGPRDYSRFTGSRVRIRFVSPDTGKRATVTGRLSDFRPETGEIRLTELDGGKEMTIQLGSVQLAKLTIDL